MTLFRRRIVRHMRLAALGKPNRLELYLLLESIEF